MHRLMSSIKQLAYRCWLGLLFLVTNKTAASLTNSMTVKASKNRMSKEIIHSSSSICNHFECADNFPGLILRCGGSSMGCFDSFHKDFDSLNVVEDFASCWHLLYRWARPWHQFLCEQLLYAYLIYVELQVGTLPRLSREYTLSSKHIILRLASMT